jgi:hypothetical protein
MKKPTVIVLVLFIGLQLIFAQSPSDKIEAFRAEVLPKYNGFFSAAEVTQNGQLKLTAVENYNQLTIAGKKAVMDNLIKNWQESLVLLQYGTKNELWGWNGKAGEALLLDAWDVNATPVAQTPGTFPSEKALHPWFFYVGGGGQFTSDKNININFNTRIGFFLLLNRWDLAASFSTAILGNTDSDASTNQTGLGLMSKLYFPIKKINISPNIGGEIAWNVTTSDAKSSSSFDPFLLVGISWYVGGNGSLDIGGRIGSQSTAMIGYTIIPTLR